MVTVQYLHSYEHKSMQNSLSANEFVLCIMFIRTSQQVRSAVLSSHAPATMPSLRKIAQIYGAPNAFSFFGPVISSGDSCIRS